MNTPGYSDDLQREAELEQAIRKVELLGLSRDEFPRLVDDEGRATLTLMDVDAIHSLIETGMKTWPNRNKWKVKYLDEIKIHLAIAVAVDRMPFGNKTQTQFTTSLRRRDLELANFAMKLGSWAGTNSYSDGVAVIQNIFQDIDPKTNVSMFQEWKDDPFLHQAYVEMDIAGLIEYMKDIRAILSVRERELKEEASLAQEKALGQLEDRSKRFDIMVKFGGAIPTFIKKELAQVEGSLKRHAYREADSKQRSQEFFASYCKEVLGPLGGAPLFAG